MTLSQGSCTLEHFFGIEIYKWLVAGSHCESDSKSPINQNSEDDHVTQTCKEKRWGGGGGQCNI